MNLQEAAIHCEKAWRQCAKKNFKSDVASLVGNALILALYFDVDLETNIKAKFPVTEDKGM